MTRDITFRALSLMLTVIVVACSPETNGTDSAPTPTTARITDDPDDRPRLLTTEDILAVPGAPRDLEEVDTRDAPIYENPDPRGPCGAKMKQPPRAGELVTFRAEGFLIAERLFEMEESSAEDLIAAYREDIDPNCPSFTSQTHTAALQQNDFLHEVELPADLGNAVATMSYVQFEGSLPLYAGMAIFEEDGTLGFLSVASGAEIPDALLRGITEQAVSKI
ncbi:MAG: hypothetical protein M3174_05045 [Actinomycetota bacterium]|nr:hypothetical protein [Actinomycetota bacterium]